MKILNFGSLNLDYVYAVDHIVQPGETILSKRLDVFCGGKGLNQSIALARAGAKVHQAGMIGADGDMLLAACAESGIDASGVKRVRERTGNAIIQVGGDGQNSIVLFGGANRKNDKAHVDSVLAGFGSGDLLLLQNEINLVDYIIDQASARGMRIAINPSPFDAALAACDLGKIAFFILNEVEGEQLTGSAEPEAILRAMREKYPDAGVALTLGSRGVVYQDAESSHSHGVYAVDVVDTTAAGDTFTGYFLAATMEALPVARALELASAAAAIAVSRPGATSSIPFRSEVEKLLPEMREKTSNK